LVYDRKTRVGGEFYLYYNLGIPYYFGALGVDGESAATYRADPTCGSSGTIPVSGFAVVRAKTPIKAAVDTTWTVNSMTAVLPAYSPPGQSAELGSAAPNSISAVNTYNVTDGEPGDGVDIIMLPNPANDVLICYDQGLNAESGAENRAIPRKFNPVDHYVRQRPDNRITLREMYCCNLQGLSLLRQRDFTLIGKFFPDGGAVPSEVRYYTNVRFNLPVEIPQESNDSVMISAEGMFRDMLAFTARPE
jgi:hypothetical protein